MKTLNPYNETMNVYAFIYPRYLTKKTNLKLNIEVNIKNSPK